MIMLMKQWSQNDVIMTLTQELEGYRVTTSHGTRESTRLFNTYEEASEYFDGAIV